MRNLDRKEFCGRRKFNLFTRKNPPSSLLLFEEKVISSIRCLCFSEGWRGQVDYRCVRVFLVTWFFALVDRRFDYTSIRAEGSFTILSNFDSELKIFLNMPLHIRMKSFIFHLFMCFSTTPLNGSYQEFDHLAHLDGCFSRATGVFSIDRTGKTLGEEADYEQIEIHEFFIGKQ